MDWMMEGAHWVQYVVFYVCLVLALATPIAWAIS